MLQMHWFSGILYLSTLLLFFNFLYYEVFTAVLVCSHYFIYSVHLNYLENERENETHLPVVNKEKK